MKFVGIDWSSQYNDICFLNEKEKKVKEFRIKINQNGFQYFLEQLNLFSTDKDEIMIGIVVYGYAGVPIAGSNIINYRGRIGGRQ